MNTSVLLLGAYAAGAASGAGVIYLWLRTPRWKRNPPIPPDWVPRAAEPVPLAKLPDKAVRSPFAPKPRVHHWLSQSEAKAAVLEALKPSRSKIEPTSSRLPSIGWGKPDAK